MGKAMSAVISDTKSAVVNETKRTVVKVDGELMERYRRATVAYNTLSRVMDASVAHGADVTTPAYQTFIFRSVQEKLEVDSVWNELFELAAANGWREGAFTPPSLRAQAGTLSFAPFDIPEASTPEVPNE